MTRVERAIFFGVPAVVLVTAYLGICVLAGTAWPWPVVVHEDGIRTLFGTVFYVEHATRELLPDATLALAAAGAVLCFFPPADPRARGRARVVLGVVALGTLAVIVGGTAATDGWQTVKDNLSQLHTREGAPVEFGAHWRYHLIELFALILLAFSVAGVVWIGRGRPDRPTSGAGLRLWLGSLVLFTVATWFFGWNRLPFEDPAYLGHQLRELLTHGLVTLPLALGACLTRSRESFFSARGAEKKDSRQGSSDPVFAGIFAIGAAAVLCGGFLMVAASKAGAQSAGQTEGLAALLFPHFAEHFLGYLLVPCLAAWICLGPRKRSRESFFRP